MSTSVTPGQFGFILRRRSRLRRFVILPSDGSGGALIRIRCAARRRADRFIDRLSRLLISIFTPWSRASDILAGRTFTVSHKSPQNYRLVMKLLCREDHNGGASRSDVGDRRSKLGSEPLTTVGSPTPRQADLARSNGGPIANSKPADLGSLYIHCRKCRFEDLMACIPLILLALRSGISSAGFWCIQGHRVDCRIFGRRF
jgi:hypothetical protein